MKTSNNDVQTASETSDEKSKWSKFCQKRGVNSNLIMLKLSLFVMHGGESFIVATFERAKTCQQVQSIKKSLLEICLKAFVQMIEKLSCL